MVRKEMAKSSTPVALVSTAKVDEYRKRAESDFNPAEATRERLARLKAEAAEVEAQLKQEEQGTLNEVLRPAINDIIAVLESQTGRKCRNFTLRYQQPGDGDPSIVPVVVKLEQGKAGMVINFRVVKPRQKDGA